MTHFAPVTSSTTGEKGKGEVGRCNEGKREERKGIREGEKEREWEEWIVYGKVRGKRERLDVCG